MKRRLLICVLLTIATERWLESQGYVPPTFWEIREEGSGLGSISALDCVGAGVTCTASGGTGTVTVPLGAGAGPAGNTNEAQYNAGSGVFGGMALFETDGTNPILVPATTDAAAPSAGVKLSSHAPSGWTFPFAKLRTPSDRAFPLIGPMFGTGGATCVIPGNGSALGGWGDVPIQSPTVTQPTLATTNLVTSMLRWHMASVATAGNSAQISAAQDAVWRGNAAGLGGFLFWARFATVTAVAQQRLFVGLYDTTGGIANVNPSTLLDTVYVGYDSAATVLSVCTNDNSGSSTCTSLGANFPVNSTAVYDVWFYSPPNGSEIDYYVERLDSAQFASGAISSDLPRNTVFLNYHAWVNNGTTASSAQLDVAALCHMSLL